MTKLYPTPNDAPDSYVHQLFELAASLVRALNPETIFRKEPEIDLRRRYDIDTDYCSAARWSERYTAIDLNSYDGASEGGISACIGRGPSPQAARFDLLEQLAEYNDHADLFDEAAEDRRYEPIPGTLGKGDEPTDYRPAPDNHHEIEEPQ